MERGAQCLLDCLRVEELTEKRSRLSNYSYDDWSALYETALQHGSGPILYSSLKEYFSHISMSTDLLENLRASYFAAAARNMRLYRQLLDVVQVLNDSGIEVILLKGAHLAKAVYGNIALRSMSDLDLLARRDDLKRIHELLTGNGYNFTHQGSLSTTKHLPPYRRDKGVCLEIHFHITDPPYSNRIQIEDLWKRARRDTFQGTEVITLGFEDLYLHLCIHSSIQHGFDAGLVSCLDIATLIHRCREAIDWDLVWKKGNEWGVARSVYLMALLAEKMLGVEMPGGLEDKVEASKELNKYLAAAEEIIFSRGKRSSSNGKGINRYLARLFSGKSLRVKLIYFKERAFPPGETLLEGSNDPQSKKGMMLWILYLKRIRKLLKRHGLTVFHGMVGSRDTLAAIETQNEKNKLRDWLSGLNN